MTLPEQETVHGGLDALSHAMEAIWNKNHNPVSDAFALEAIASIIENLPALRREPQNLALRSALLCASLCAGMAFSATRTALAHSISYPLTAHLGLSHGLACALPLPLLIEFNGTHDFDRIKIMAKPLKAHMSPASMQERLHGFFAELGIVYGLRNYGVDERTADVIAESAYTPERADNNIRAIHRNDLRKLVRKLL
jgi:alcohol dehydrogenase